jgi:hypothetical protein
MPRAPVPTVVVALLAAFGCAALLGVGHTATPPGFHGNLLANPGFEEGEAGWTYPMESPYWGKFELVEAPVRSGRRAAHLRLRAGSEDQTHAAWILGVMQELTPERFPDVMGGWYRVERWEKGADVTHLYLQAVAIVWTSQAPSVLNPANPAANEGLLNYQLRSYLAGVSEPPFLLANARVTFVSKELPRPGRWTYFEVPLRQEFEHQWGGAPTGYDRLRLLFEARWDNRPAGSRIEADAYFDDLFVGYVDPTP